MSHSPRVLACRVPWRIGQGAAKFSRGKAKGGIECLARVEALAGNLGVKRVQYCLIARKPYDDKAPVQTKWAIRGLLARTEGKASLVM